VATREQHDQPVMFTPISGKQIPLAPTHIISQTAFNAMTMKEALYVPKHSLTVLSSLLHMLIMHVPNYAHYASPMIHPTTGEIISVTNA
jgi:hypothetical protein